METIWYVKRGDKVYGPYSLPKLKAALAKGRLRRTDLVRPEGGTTWTPATRVDGLVSVHAESSSAGDLTCSVPAAEMERKRPWWILVVWLLVWAIPVAAAIGAIRLVYNDRQAREARRQAEEQESYASASREASAWIAGDSDKSQESVLELLTAAQQRKQAQNDPERRNLLDLIAKVEQGRDRRPRLASGLNRNSSQPADTGTQRPRSPVVAGATPAEVVTAAPAQEQTLLANRNSHAAYPLTVSGPVNSRGFRRTSCIFGSRHGNSAYLL